MSEPDPAGSLAGGGEEHLGRARVRVLLEEVVLDLPQVVDPEPVGELHLVERVAQELALVELAIHAGQLMLIEDAEPHEPRRYSLPIATRRPPLPPARGDLLCDPVGVLHHVSLEVAPDDVEATVEFFELLGFTRIAAPESIAPFVTWLEADGSQIHLIHTPEPTTPRSATPRWSPSNSRQTVERLRAMPASSSKRPTSCGESAAFAVAPSGQRVELMAAPPPRTT